MVLRLTILLGLCSPLESVFADRDWSASVLHLKSREGQNFEQDLQLVRAYLQLERRAEALKVLRRWWGAKSEDLVQRHFDLAGSLFFFQETSNLYFEAVRLVSVRNWALAREKLEQALKREPEHLLILTRMIQVDFQLGQKQAVLDRVKTVLELYPNPREAKVFLAKMELEEEDYRLAIRGFLSQKNWAFEHEVPTIWYFEALLLAKRSHEILPMQKQILKRQPHWIELRQWLLRKGVFYPEQLTRLKKEIEKATEDLKTLSQIKEAEYRKGNYFWVSAKTVEQLEKEYAQWVGP